MFKRFLATAACLIAFGDAAAAVDVNVADEAALCSIKGIGPAKARAIISARTTDGPFVDAADLAQRVKGLGPRSVERLQDAGLVVGYAAPSPGAAPAHRAAGGHPAPSTSDRRAAVVVKQ
jgi:competence protein ComEA